MSDAELVITNPEFRIFDGSLLNPIQQAYIEKMVGLFEEPSGFGQPYGQPVLL